MSPGAWGEGEGPRAVWRISKGMFLSERARREHHGTHTGATAGACLLFPEAVSEENLRASPVCSRNVRVWRAHTGNRV